MTIYQRELIRESLIDHGVIDTDADYVLDFIEEILGEKEDDIYE